MKILFYNHTGQVSGAERVLLMILAGLDRSRFVSVLLCPTAGPLDYMARDLGVRTVAVERVAARFTLRPDRLIKYCASLVRVIQIARATISKEAPDVIHANSIRAGLVMSLATVGLDVPVVWHAHDLLPRHPLSAVIRFVAGASRRNRIVAVSNAVANSFAGSKGGRRLCVDTIYNAVDLERFHPDPISREAIRSALGIAERQTAIGIVGQLTPRKGQLELIEAFASIAEEVPDSLLLIIGEAVFSHDVKYAESLALAARSSGVSDRIRFLGPREDVPAIMLGLDLLVVNSKNEPFGLTAIEAMASGTAVLATAVDGLAEIVRHGDTGWLVPPQDQRALAEALRTLALDRSRRECLGLQGPADAITRFSAARFLDDMQSLYGSASTGSILQPEVLLCHPRPISE